mmetsp:Transcript_24980/g.58960  ORF Transcript_24980/g.58960 Transcript_24980/m.58960 type:complete len:253 (+) Transcript_24980:1047-1805(+)
MQRVNALPLLSVHKQYLFYGSDVVVIVIVIPVSIRSIFLSLLAVFGIAVVKLGTKISCLFGLICHLPVDRCFVPAFGSERFVGFPPTPGCCLGYHIEVRQYDDAGSPSTPFSYPWVSRRLAGSGISYFYNHVNRFERFGELPLGLCDMSGVPLNNRAVVSAVCGRGEFCNVIIDIVIVIQSARPLEIRACWCPCQEKISYTSLRSLCCRRFRNPRNKRACQRKSRNHRHHQYYDKGKQWIAHRERPFLFATE